tara:strand:+ start:1265 stop:1996 length:732 start_codon:yes stop_codon:yes gene_type:complete
MNNNNLNQPILDTNMNTNMNSNSNSNSNISVDIVLPQIDNKIEFGNFEIENNSTNMDLYNLSSIHDDDYQRDLRTVQSLNVGNYKLGNFYPKDCGQESARNIQLSQSNVNFVGGQGWIGSDGCLVDTDSQLRFKESTNKNYINQLQERLVKTTPFIRGILDVDVESQLLPGNKTDSRKAVGDYAGVSTYDRQVTPLIEKLEKEVQNPNHLIQENVDKDWIHGGIPTREIMRNIDYLKRCNNEK